MLRHPIFLKSNQYMASLKNDKNQKNERKTL